MQQCNYHLIIHIINNNKIKNNLHYFNLKANNSKTNNKKNQFINTTLNNTDNQCRKISKKNIWKIN